MTEKGTDAMPASVPFYLKEQLFALVALDLADPAFRSFDRTILDARKSLIQFCCHRTYAAVSEDDLLAVIVDPAYW